MIEPTSLEKIVAPVTETGLPSWKGHMADDVGSTYGPDPLAALTVTPDGLVLIGNRGTFRIPRDRIVRLGRGDFYPWFFGAVRIHHAVPGYPGSLQFKPLGLKPREVLAKLRELGYPA